VRKYQLHLVSRGLQAATIIPIICAIRFFYGTTLGRAGAAEHIPLGDCHLSGRSRQCRTFSYSHPEVPGYSVHDIVRIGQSRKKLEYFMDEHIFVLDDVPDDYELGDAQKLQVEAHKKQNQIIVRDAIEEILGAYKFPLYFLDQTFRRLASFCRVSRQTRGLQSALPNIRLPRSSTSSTGRSMRGSLILRSSHGSPTWVARR
jgi:hypothetical protein